MASPIASVPLVTARISYRTSLAELRVTGEIALQTASTGPSPIAAPSRVSSFTRIRTVAVGMADVPL